MLNHTFLEVYRLSLLVIFVSARDEKKKCNCKNESWELLLTYLPANLDTLALF